MLLCNSMSYTHKYNVHCLGCQSPGNHTTPGLHCGWHAKECRSATQLQIDPVQVRAQLCRGQWGTETEMAENHPSSCHRWDTRWPKWASRHLEQSPWTKEKVRMLNCNSCRCGSQVRQIEDIPTLLSHLLALYIEKYDFVNSSLGDFLNMFVYS